MLYRIDWKGEKWQVWDEDWNLVDTFTRIDIHQPCRLVQIKTERGLRGYLEVPHGEKRSGIVDDHGNNVLFMVHDVNTHHHKCHDCGTIWEHDNSCAVGDVDDDPNHRCPKCGKVTFERYQPSAEELAEQPETT